MKLNSHQERTFTFDHLVSAKIIKEHVSTATTQEYKDRLYFSVVRDKEHKTMKATIGILPENNGEYSPQFGNLTVTAMGKGIKSRSRPSKYAWEKGVKTNLVYKAGARVAGFESFRAHAVDIAQTMISNYKNLKKQVDKK